MEKEQKFTNAYVEDDEKIVRFILRPRDWSDETKRVIDGFVTLRKNEPGVSCIRYDYLGGYEPTVKKGVDFAETVNKRKKEGTGLEKLHGWGHCTAKDIIDLDPDVISLSIDNPEHNPEHVCICFNKNGGIVKGIVKDAYIMDLFDQIQETFEYYLIPNE